MQYPRNDGGLDEFKRRRETVFVERWDLATGKMLSRADGGNDDTRPKLIASPDGILILGTGAAVMALIPLVGAIYAQLIVAGVFLLVIVGTMVWLQRPARQAAAQRAVPVGAASTDGNQRTAQFAQIAMIIEAVMLGYSMSRRR